MSYFKKFRTELKGQEFFILDTEATGLYDAEIVEIAILSSKNECLLDTYVKPTIPVPSEATAIHGIADKDLTDAPLWKDILPKVLEIIGGNRVVVYNVAFDKNMLMQTTKKALLAPIEWEKRVSWFCAMTAFAEDYGAWNAHYKSYRWQSLSVAMSYINKPFINDAHSAIGDCMATLDVTNYLLREIK